MSIEEKIQKLKDIEAVLGAIDVLKELTEDQKLDIIKTLGDLSGILDKKEVTPEVFNNAIEMFNRKDEKDFIPTTIKSTDEIARWNEVYAKYKSIKEEAIKKRDMIKTAKDNYSIKNHKRYIDADITKINSKKKSIERTIDILIAFREVFKNSHSFEELSNQQQIHEELDLLKDKITAIKEFNKKIQDIKNMSLDPTMEKNQIQLLEEARKTSIGQANTFINNIKNVDSTYTLTEIGEDGETKNINTEIGSASRNNATKIRIAKSNIDRIKKTNAANLFDETGIDVSGIDADKLDEFIEEKINVLEEKKVLYDEKEEKAIENKKDLEYYNSTPSSKPVWDEDKKNKKREEIRNDPNFMEEVKKIRDNMYNEDFKIKGLKDLFTGIPRRHMEKFRYCNSKTEEKGKKLNWFRKAVNFLSAIRPRPFAIKNNMLEAAKQEVEDEKLDEVINADKEKYDKIREKRNGIFEKLNKEYINKLNECVLNGNAKNPEKEAYRTTDTKDTNEPIR